MKAKEAVAMATPRAGSVVNKPAGLKADDGGFGVGFFISFHWLLGDIPVDLGSKSLFSSVELGYVEI